MNPTKAVPRPFLLLILLGALVVVSSTRPAPASAAPDAPSTPRPAVAAVQASAIFAGGCFWCLEKPFDRLDGVLSTTSGYTGGKLANPTYEQVSSGRTGHIEAVRVDYDPQKISYPALLEVFWRNIDPLDAGGQFCDRGSQYQSAIFYKNDEERRSAEASSQAWTESGDLDGVIATRILAAGPFFEAEEYHQDYYKKNPVRYGYYRYRCGRDSRLEKVWRKAAQRARREQENAAGASQEHRNDNNPG